MHAFLVFPRFTYISSMVLVGLPDGSGRCHFLWLSLSRVACSVLWYSVFGKIFHLLWCDIYWRCCYSGTHMRMHFYIYTSLLYTLISCWQITDFSLGMANPFFFFRHGRILILTLALTKMGVKGRRVGVSLHRPPLLVGNRLRKSIIVCFTFNLTSDPTSVQGDWIVKWPHEVSQVDKNLQW